ncbi:hypothetical protein BKA70DRAFT_1337334 [Coprinopsis sp. MPI-PUGE-AT-0042]|nr:hypothetical protein BKA70DRAFT_1337334 [Coprinopsis sp. MPI-PUGE-AT-0042]
MPREIDVVCLTLLIYDYMWTLKEEVGQGMFYLNRYLVFVDQILSSTLCTTVWRAGVWILIVGENISTVIIFLQTWAIWGGKRRVVYPLAFLQLIKVIVSFVIAHLVWDYASYPVGPSTKGPVCLIKVPALTTLVKYRYILFTFSEALSIGLTLMRARYHLKKSRSSWVTQLYKMVGYSFPPAHHTDSSVGILYSAVVLTLSVANLIILGSIGRYLLSLTSDPSMIGILSRPQRILDSILCNRVMFVIFKNRKISNRLPQSYSPSSPSGEHSEGELTTEMSEAGSKGSGRRRPTTGTWVS